MPDRDDPHFKSEDGVTVPAYALPRNAYTGVDRSERPANRPASPWRHPMSWAALLGSAASVITALAALVALTK
ncbi:hypothetical protein GCM10010259_16480 [Streptomyces daghestanicus]|uniref:Crotonobetainyl-CoA:carnitine CoA-transferase CaiB-like acyl-CoA transferase n=2 Tax=Streptomyces TaxID=1883 RepID=A0ABT9LGV6_STRGD|nr:crotonobetainyl-CoA:carnitine CoA-transferase CaiB-like acyl-CoA transferase [Streptomyces griseoviridis]GGS90505.1 hypothetical protein GCM10010240_24880 [Streptomyces griseoviridis]GGU26547.1 hypothetical protein GCM10010259_16480 [Streptomyces daghestanicus]GHI32579.1 hypothetical protein Sdagh_43090 [Streptomyces daghestanicus]